MFKTLSDMLREAEFKGVEQRSWLETICGLYASVLSDSESEVLGAHIAQLDGMLESFRIFSKHHLGDMPYGLPPYGLPPKV